jgi:hypothetical protein
MTTQCVRWLFVLSFIIHSNNTSSSKRRSDRAVFCKRHRVWPRVATNALSVILVKIVLALLAMR